MADTPTPATDEQQNDDGFRPLPPDALKTEARLRTLASNTPTMAQRKYRGLSRSAVLILIVLTTSVTMAVFIWHAESTLAAIRNIANLLGNLL